MPNPKRRHSGSRRGKRRSHDSLLTPNIPSSQRLQRTSGTLSKRFICPQCKQVKTSHAICHNCGYYNGRQVVAVERV
ncbi:MAG: 50S ribosomal protein L32 [Candidatus Brocadiales bacterium]|nr:50S ribosomal protein L32 [Candidatus Bathyanammoxibius sp.]